jgi:hypothetical protein
MAEGEGYGVGISERSIAFSGMARCEFYTGCNYPGHRT